jgi:hypothetical protein
MIEAFLTGVARMIPSGLVDEIVVFALVLFAALILFLALYGLAFLLEGALNLFAQAERDAHGGREHGANNNEGK